MGIVSSLDACEPPSSTCRSIGKACGAGVHAKTVSVDEDAEEISRAISRWRTGTSIIAGGKRGLPHDLPSSNGEASDASLSSSSSQAGHSESSVGKSIGSALA